MVVVKKVTLTPAAIVAMFAVPLKVLNAPPANKINNILAISHDMTFATAAYTGALRFYYGNNAALALKVFFEENTLSSAVNVNLPAQKGIASETVFSTTKDFYVTTDALAATGDSTITAYIVYEESDII